MSLDTRYTSRLMESMSGDRQLDWAGHRGPPEIFQCTVRKESKMDREIHLANLYETHGNGKEI